MQLGIAITWPDEAREIGPAVARLACAAEAAGVDDLWAADHFFQIPITGLPREAPMLEAYAALGFVAGMTRRIRLGALVTAVPYRHPGVLIKSVTALDVLTGGRMALGVGAGWDREEAAALGIPFPPTAERFERLEELLRIAHQMWRGDEAPFVGRHHRLDRPLNSPGALQRPHPPILIGGGGERKTLRLVAQYADACNLFDFAGRFEFDLEHKLRVLRDHCRAVGRDYDEIEKTVAIGLDLRTDPSGGVRRLVERLRELAAIGIQHAIVGPLPRWDDAGLAALAMAVPEVHAIQVAPLRRLGADGHRPDAPTASDAASGLT
ncbi:MAG TPA: LLM class F420-dependent oxidoreductase [Terriglobales bacterium]|nr:LLM class F420-dependent oxidoreductase [Terriglobales bacterium]